MLTAKFTLAEALRWIRPFASRGHVAHFRPNDGTASSSTSISTRITRNSTPKHENQTFSSHASACRDSLGSHNHSQSLRYRAIQSLRSGHGSNALGRQIAKLCCGTTTPTSTYTDSTGATANANPVILDGSGEAAVWLDPAVTATSSS
jgi:hypothetical protein